MKLTKRRLTVFSLLVIGILLIGIFNVYGLAGFSIDESHGCWDITTEAQIRTCDINLYADITYKKLVTNFNEWNHTFNSFLNVGWDSQIRYNHTVYVSDWDWELKWYEHYKVIWWGILKEINVTVILPNSTVITEQTLAGTPNLDMDGETNVHLWKSDTNELSYAIYTSPNWLGTQVILADGETESQSDWDVTLSYKCTKEIILGDTNGYADVFIDNMVGVGDPITREMVYGGFLDTIIDSITSFTTFIGDSVRDIFRTAGIGFITDFIDLAFELGVMTFQILGILFPFFGLIFVLYFLQTLFRCMRTGDFKPLFSFIESILGFFMHIVSFIMDLIPF